MSSENINVAPSSHQLIPLREVVKLTHAHPNTLRRWANSGELPCYRIGNHGHRRWKLSDVLAYVGIEENVANESCLIVYARTSSRSQAKGFLKGEESDLTRQIERLKKAAQDEYGMEPLVFSDIGSGLSYTRKGLKKLIDGILSNKFNGSTLLLTHKDRLARFGVELIEQICNAHQIKIIYTEKELDESQERELAEDLMAIIHVFSSRHYGARGAKSNQKHLSKDTIERAKDLKDQGISVSQIVERMNKEGFTTECQSPISEHVIKKYVMRNVHLEEVIPAKHRNSVDDYIDDCLEIADETTRIKSADLFKDYVEFCKKNNKASVLVTRFGAMLKKRFRSVWIVDTKSKNKDGYGKPGAGFAGVIIKGKKKHWEIKPRKKPKTPPESPTDNFIKFYDEVLSGKWSGFRRELDARYGVWCEENDLRPINRNKIPKLLRQMGNHYPKRKSKGFFYDFT